MLSSLIALVLISQANVTEVPNKKTEKPTPTSAQKVKKATAPEEAILNKVPKDWYMSTTNLFEYCVNVRFQHPICPKVSRGDFAEFDFQSSFFKPPVGGLDPETLFQASVLYQVNRPPAYWFIGLKLDEKNPKSLTKALPPRERSRLLAEARLLWAQILFDRRQYDEALRFFDMVVDEFKGRALFHQQRAWAQFFNKKFDKALGSIVSAESPSIYSIPFFDKWFLRALIEKENCLYSDAVSTIQAGRKHLKSKMPDPNKHPWVKLCNERKLGTTCTRLRNWHRKVYEAKTRSALEDLDLLEIELRDRLTPGQKKKSTSSIVWPYVGEGWSDEIGYYSVPISSACN